MNENLLSDAIKIYGNSVLRTAVCITGNLQDAEDVFSDVFFAAWQADKPFESDKHFKAWLIRVTVNKAKNIRKQAHNRYKAELTENIPYPDMEEKSGFDVPCALLRLKPKERAVLFLHYYEGYTYGEIASMLKMREVSVRSKALRARAHMKDFLLE